MNQTLNNVSVSNTSIDDVEIKRKSFIENRSKTNIKVSNLNERRKSSMIHLKTEVEKRNKNQLEVLVPETMKNIPSPDSFINNKIGDTNNLGEIEIKSKYYQGGLETIHDDPGSDFKSDKDFEENNDESNDFGYNLKKKNNQKETQNSISMDSDLDNKNIMKQDTLGVKINDESTTNKYESQQTQEMDGKRLPRDKADTNITLSKSEISNVEGHHRFSKTSGFGKENSKSGWSQKKRQTTFVQSGDNFFGISDKTNRIIARKKSTSNFLCNYGIIEKSEHSTQSDKVSKKKSHSSEEDKEFVAEIVTKVEPNNVTYDRQDSNDFTRNEMLRIHKRQNDQRVGFESTENSQLIGSAYVSKNSFKSNLSHAIKISHKNSSDTVVQLKSVALQNTGNSTAFKQLKSGKDSESVVPSDAIY